MKKQIDEIHSHFFVFTSCAQTRNAKHTINAECKLHWWIVDNSLVFVRLKKSFGHFVKLVSIFCFAKFRARLRLVEKVLRGDKNCRSWRISPVRFLLLFFQIFFFLVFSLLLLAAMSAPAPPLARRPDKRETRLTTHIIIHFHLHTDQIPKSKSVFWCRETAGSRYTGYIKVAYDRRF